MICIKASKVFSSHYLSTFKVWLHEMHISGVLVHAKPEHLATVLDGVSRIEGLEVHATDEDGKIVVTLENENEQASGQVFELINQLPGVLSATMIYHHFEPDSAESDS